MWVVTGGAGFIGSNLVRGLNRNGLDDILVVDDLSDGHKFENLAETQIADYLDVDEFLERLPDIAPDGILHQGACTVTTEWNGRYMLARNYRYSVELLEYARGRGIPLIYASSAAVYGASARFVETEAGLERPLNVYGYSKLLFDRYVRRTARAGDAQVAGLRYFNVYGPGESHKGPMASVVLHFSRELARTGQVSLFVGSAGYADGEQRRDFVFVDDVVDVNLWLMEHPAVNGIFNVGTGASATFNEVARAVIDWHGAGEIRYVPFPDGLEASYQSFTEADISALRAVGCDVQFRGVTAGVKAYLDRADGVR
jgi:ADP-L-glycero-D-manno-heptose 6-epimerase